MPKIELEDLTPEQEAVIQVIINEGKMLAYEELLDYFKREYQESATQDPYYGYYVKYVIEEIEKRYQPLAKAVE